MKKTRSIRIFTCALCLVIQVLSAADSIQDFNFDWRFAKGDQTAAIEPSYDDSLWEQVDLPHDWAISGPFGDRDAEGITGKLPWQGEGYYRKQFDLPADAKGKRLQFIFDGVMSSPVVYLNGQKVGSWIYGYNSFWVDATEAANFGGSNVMTVHADTRAHGSRWYPGAGIYRKITMRFVDTVHIPVWGVFVTTPKVSDAEAEVHVSVELKNATAQTQKAGIETLILDPHGNRVSGQREAVTVAPGGIIEAEFNFKIPQPQRWDVDMPNLYQVVTLVVLAGEVVQEEVTTFGLRTFEWTADDGFHLNGRRMQLYGVNLHHDQGPLGAAFFPRSMERQLQIMKDMGVNAIRTSHNTPAPELLELCDRMGLVVWDELFDKYGPTAGVQCSTDEFVDEYAEREVVNFMRRDRNHPSVVIWSIGNEIRDLTQQHAEKMLGYFRSQDTTRPVGIGCHMTQHAATIVAPLDVTGWNYNQKYMIARKHHPEMPLVYTETASAFGTRGAYKLAPARNKTDWRKDGYLDANVLTSAAWSDIPEWEFDRMRKHRFIAGEFVWTGFDYLGEPTPHKTSRSSYFGIVDLAGLPKDSYYLYRSEWLPEENTVHLAPHWNWEPSDKVPVTVYTNGDSAELFLNGKSLGRRSKGKARADAYSSLAFGKIASASSEELIQDAGGNVQSENLARNAVDNNPSTRWCANDGSFPQHWQVDLGEVNTFEAIDFQWESAKAQVQFDILISQDGQSWETIQGEVGKSKGATRFVTATQSARWVKVQINKVEGGWASIREVEIHADRNAVARSAVNPYYRILDEYRLRWMEVPFEAGELKTVAYKDGKRIGEAIVKTAGEPAKLQLTADRTELQADGMDLCYVTVELLDRDGNLCPWAMDDLTFNVEGAARLAGVANGDQTGHDSFTDETHPLFFGKAVAVMRNVPGKSGEASMTVESPAGLQSEIIVQFNRPNE
ncbi:MAG: glycoside hydrolase family 2 TIM barrel-domain containing protein [Opitutaceae bacterium]